MRNLTLVVLVMSVLGTGLELGAQETLPKDDFPPSMYKRIEKLKLPRRDVVDTLTKLAEQGGINIVISKAVSGRCTLSLKDVPIKDAFDIVLLSSGLAYAKRGEIYYIMTAKEYRDRYGTTYGDAREIKIMRLKYAVPATAFKLVTTMMNEEFGKVVVDEESGTLLIMDAPESIKKMEEALAVLERRNEVMVFDINYADAADIQKKIEMYLTPSDNKVGSVTATEKTNQLVVQTLPERMEGVRELIAALDKKTKQVLIDTKIIKIELNDDFSAELKWEGIFTGLSGVDFLSSHALDPVWRTGESFIGQYAENVPDPLLPGSKSLLGEKIFIGAVQSGHAFEGLLSFLRTLGDVKILSNPKIAAISGQEAKIHVGRKEPYLTSTTSSAGESLTTSETVDFVDIGILLSVTPTINEDGYIKMQVNPQVIDLIKTLETEAGSVVPIVDTSEAETTVMVKDGATIMIGGLRKDEERKMTRKVPILGSIPLLGGLFRSHTSQSLRGELLIMLTPHIISGDTLELGEPAVPAEGF